MTTGWTFAGEPSVVGPGGVTLVEGSTFCLCDRTGDIEPGGTQGLFVQDTRVVSRWQLRLDDEPLQPLTMLTNAPYRASFLCRVKPTASGGERALLVRRDRFVGNGMREDISVVNLRGETSQCELTLTVDCDFADLFEVKEGRVRGRGERTTVCHDTALEYTYSWRERTRACRVTVELGEDGDPTTLHVLPGLVVFRVLVPPRGTWRASVLATTGVDGRALHLQFPLDRPVEDAAPATRLVEWVERAPRVLVRDRSLVHAWDRSRADLGSLRIHDSECGTTAVAAGAPWFMTLFGRDSLLTSYMALPLDPSLAVGTLRTLASHQGRQVDPRSEEEPGRILHEVRAGVDAELALGGSNVYYGTADATPLFVVLLGELRRWGLAEQDVADLLPHADRALEWIEQYGDRDGDGFVEYQRATDRGLVNQGWKDSWDGINFADGRIAEPPIALAEVQGYVYAAYLARAYLAQQQDDRDTAEHYVHRARRLRKEFNEKFWLPDRGWYAVALDRNKRPVDALTSNIGHCLWSGIVDPDRATAVAERLLSPEMFTGWGVRTLASTMGAYNPMSYHNGSVWPHDNALVASGLMRYGFTEQAQRVACGILDAAAAFDGRLPELFCGFDRDEYPAPVPYPTSCSPQAWAAATPIQLLRVLLGFTPDIPNGRVWLNPALPPRLADLSLLGLPLAGTRVDIRVRGGEVEVSGLPEGVELIRAPRPVISPILTHSPRS